MTTITFNERKWAAFLGFVFLGSLGLFLSLTSFDPPMIGRSWAGGVFCGISFGFWVVFLTHGTDDASGRQDG